MATIDKELRELVENLVLGSEGYVEDDGSNIMNMILVAQKKKVNKALSDIKALILKNLPKDKPNKHKGIVQEGTSEYAYLNGVRDGYNQCLSEIRGIYE